MKGNIYLITQFLSKMVSKHNCVLFRMRKRTKKCGELRFFPHPFKRPLAERGKGSTRTTNKKRFCKLDKTFFPFIFVLAVFYSSLIIAGQSLGLCHFDAELSVARNPKPCSVIITTLIKPFY